MSACAGHPSVFGFSLENESDRTGFSPEFYGVLIDEAVRAGAGVPLTTEGSPGNSCRVNQRGGMRSCNSRADGGVPRQSVFSSRGIIFVNDFSWDSGIHADRMPCCLKLLLSVPPQATSAYTSAV